MASWRSTTGDEQTVQVLGETRLTATVGVAMRVAVTGANGFVGSHVVGALLAEGHTVRAVVRDASDLAKTRHLVSLPGAGSSLTIAHGDLLVDGSYDEAFRGVQVVIHAAAVIDVLDSANAAEKILKPSLQGSQNVLKSIQRSGSVRRLVYISSVAAVQSPYGLEESHVFEEADWNSWSTLERDAYGFAKTSAERWLTDELEKDASCDLISLCPAIVLGPCLAKAHTKSSCALVRECIYHNPMNSYFGSFVDVRDLAAATVASLMSDRSRGARFIVVSDESPMLTTQLATLAAAELPQYSFVGTPKHSEWLVWLLARIGMATPFQEAMVVKRFIFSNSQLKEILGVRPRPLAETVKDTATSMIDHGWVKPKLSR